MARSPRPPATVGASMGGRVLRRRALRFGRGPRRVLHDILVHTSAHALIIVVGTRRALRWVTEPREAVATVAAAPGSRGPKTLHAAANLRLRFRRHEFVLRVDCNGYARDDAPKSARIVRSVTRPARSLRVARPRVRRRRRCESDLRSPPRRPSPEQSDTNGGPAPERPTLWCAQLGCALTGLGSS